MFVFLAKLNDVMKWNEKNYTKTTKMNPPIYVTKDGKEVQPLNQIHNLNLLR